MLLTILIAIISLIASFVTYFVTGLYQTWWLFFLIICFFIGYFVIIAFLFILVGINIVSIFDNKGKEYHKPKGYYYWVVKEISWLAVFFSNTKVTVHGLDKLPKDSNFLFTFNHTSNWDGMILFKILRKYKITFMQKKEVIYTPFIGTFFHKAGFIVIDRADLTSRIRAFRLASKTLQATDFSLGIAPEGTRNRTREYPVLPFHNGSFAIAKDAGKPIVLIGIKNAHQVKRNAPWKRTHVDFSVLAVLDKELVNSKSDNFLKEYAFNKYLEYLKEDQEDFETF